MEVFTVFPIQDSGSEERKGWAFALGPNGQQAIEGYRVTMVQIFVTSNLSIQICSIDTRDEMK